MEPGCRTDAARLAIQRSCDRLLDDGHRRSAGLLPTNGRAQGLPCGRKQAGLSWMGLDGRRFGREDGDLCRRGRKGGGRPCGCARRLGGTQLGEPPRQGRAARVRQGERPVLRGLVAARAALPAVCGGGPPWWCRHGRGRSSRGRALDRHARLHRSVLLGETSQHPEGRLWLLGAAVKHQGYGARRGDQEVRQQRRDQGGRPHASARTSSTRPPDRLNAADIITEVARQRMLALMDAKHPSVAGEDYVQPSTPAPLKRGHSLRGSYAAADFYPVD